MKNDSIVLTDVLSVITDKQQLSSNLLSPSGKMLPEGTFFKFQGAVIMRKPIQTGAKPYPSVVINYGKDATNLDLQMGVSPNFLSGTYFDVPMDDEGKPVLDSEGKILSERKNVETLWRESGLDIMEYIANNKGQIFVIKNDLTYNAKSFSKETVFSKVLLNYALYVPAKK